MSLTPREPFPNDCPLPCAPDPVHYSPPREWEYLHWQPRTHFVQLPLAEFHTFKSALISSSSSTSKSIDSDVSILAAWENCEMILGFTSTLFCACAHDALMHSFQTKHYQEMILSECIYLSVIKVSDILI